MRLAAVLLLALAGPAAADPVVVTLRDTAPARGAVVTVFDVAEIAGGTVEDRGKVAALDVAELKGKETTATVTKATVEFRLKLAGLDATVGGADRTAVTLTRRTVVEADVVAAAKAELTRLAPACAVVPVGRILVPMPEVPPGADVTVTARPHGAVAPGRVQMDAVITAGGRQLLAVPVTFDVLPVGGAATAPIPAVTPLSAPVVRAGERVTIVVKTAGISGSAPGEALQAGAVGQLIRVQNVDSRRVISARVTGPGAVAVELGGAP